MFSKGLVTLKRRFGIEAAGSSVRQEILAGVTTYLAMCYIVLVNPAVLAGAGMDEGSVMMATCLSSAIATLWMALYANYPIALAPGMGHNFFFALTVCGPAAAGGLGYSWQAALAAVFISGSLFVIASFWGMRARIISIFPAHLKTSVGVGIGLLVALVGLRWGGILVSTPGVYIGLGDLETPPVLLTLFGFLVMSILVASRVAAALVIGILMTAGMAVLTGQSRFAGVAGLPPSMAPTFLAWDFRGLFQQGDFWAVVFVFLFVDVFDTVGTLIGVGDRAGLLVDGELPRARQALLSDAVGTVVGAGMGTSTVTSYVESAAGVAVGGRTGLSAVVTALLMGASVFLYPLVRLVGAVVDNASGVVLYPILAPALVLIGIFMMPGVGRIDWAEPRQAIPAFLTLMMIPLTTSITEGISFGFISSSLLDLASRKARSLHWAVHLISGLFLLRYFLI